MKSVFLHEFLKSLCQMLSLSESNIYTAQEATCMKPQLPWCWKHVGGVVLGVGL